MQDLAVEATMSQGNIYRYFSSKEEIVLACAARQRDAAAAEIAAMAETHDELEIIFHVIERYFVDAAVERAVLAVDLWSEVRRIPALRALSDAQEIGFRDWFLLTVPRFAAPGCDVAALCLDVTTFMKGALLSRAVLPDHDSQTLMGRLRALVGERLALAPPRGKPI
ncbi:TetR/AcrR family transcriptional regulator [Methylobacterium sp. J-030]|nr:TetR/AcrR family transcriptional regulator [Methylobacterium sp. J-030]